MMTPHILFVEDEERIRTLVGKYCELESYAFTGLGSGETALSFIEET
jgi:DNA-binding response OmpR family regulator